jgi:hypothetical protein
MKLVEREVEQHALLPDIYDLTIHALRNANFSLLTDNDWFTHCFTIIYILVELSVSYILECQHNTPDTVISKATNNSKTVNYLE